MFTLDELDAALPLSLKGKMTPEIANNLNAVISDPQVAQAFRRKHKIADAWEWERENVDTDAAPLVAVTVALGLWDELREAATGYDPLANIW